MKLKWKCNLVVLLLSALTGCHQTVDHKGKKPLVGIGNDYLYEDDLKAVLPVGITGKDSISFVEQYIRNWVEETLLFQKAEGNIPDNVKIDELVASYRRALIMHVYQEELVNQEIGDNTTDEEIEEYYRQNTSLFRAGQAYVQGLFMKVPLGATQLENVRVWYKNKTQDAIDKLEKYSIGNAVSYDYFIDRWKPVSDIVAKLSSNAIKTEHDYLNRNRNIEVRDTAFYYFLHVENFLPEGEQLPLEYAKNEIKEILINLKRVEFINRMKKDLFDKASEDKNIIYY